jgi:hypothetical protein
MTFEMTPEIHGRLHEYFDKRIGQHLLIVGDGERTSAEPIGARVTG